MRSILRLFGPRPENSNKPGSFDGKAYLRVNITDANSTRASGGDLEYGDATEHEVVNADFFFYDTNGIFIARAKSGTAARRMRTTPRATSNSSENRSSC